MPFEPKIKIDPQPITMLQSIESELFNNTQMYLIEPLLRLTCVTKKQGHPSFPILIYINNYVYKQFTKLKNKREHAIYFKTNETDRSVSLFIL